VDGDEVLFGGAGEGEWMPLEVRDLRAREEDVLASPGSGLFLLDLDFHNVRRVLDDLVDMGAVTRANFAKDALENPDNATNEPVAPEDTDGVGGTVGGPVGLDHAEHAMELPVDEEHDEEVVGVPEPLKVSAPSLLHGEPHHDTECCGHDPSRQTWAGDEVCSHKGPDPLAGGGEGRVEGSELIEVDHMGKDVDRGPDDDGPSCGLVEGDVLVEGDDVVEGCATEQGDKISADGEQDEDHVDVEHKGCRTRHRWKRVSLYTGSRRAATTHGK